INSSALTRVRFQSSSIYRAVSTTGTTYVTGTTESAPKVDDGWYIEGSSVLDMMGSSLPEHHKITNIKLMRIIDGERVDQTTVTFTSYTESPIDPTPAYPAIYILVRGEVATSLTSVPAEDKVFLESSITEEIIQQ